jgi:type I restriction enzyme S subunit
VWVNFGELSNIVSARRVHQSDWTKLGIPFYRAREIVKLSEYGYVDNELYITQDLFRELSQSGIPHEGDIMVSAVGTIGKAYIVKQGDAFYYKDASVICFENFAKLKSEFLKSLIESPFMIEQIRKNSAGSTVDTITIETANQYLVPLPPLAEQRRIVAAIESAFAVIDEIEQNKTDLAAAIKQAKSKILSLAIRGKLVPQDPADEPTSVLLKRIRAEKETLVKAGKIKRGKGDVTAAISRDNSYYLNIKSCTPFDLPNSWAWVAFGSICDYGSCDSVSAERIADDAWVLDLEDIERNTAKILQFVNKKERSFTSAKHTFSKGQVLFSKLRPYLRKVVVAPKDGFCTSEILPLSFSIDICPEYVQLFLTSEFFITYTNLYACGAKMPRLGAADARKVMFSLPPLSEQQRIVARMKLAFEQLDEIAAMLA